MAKYSFLYDYDDDDKGDLIHIQLNDGKFSGVIFKYGRVNFGNQTTEGFKNISFQYDIIEDVNNKVTEANTKKFVDTIGDILIELIEKQINQTKGNGNGEH